MKITPQLVSFGLSFINEGAVLLGQSNAISPKVANVISGISQLLIQAVEEELQPVVQAPTTPVQHSLIEG